MAFRLESNDYMLTYSKCSADFDHFFEYMKTKFSDKLSYMCIAQELHQDGDTHYHVQLQFRRVYNCTSPRTFDYCGYHPKIERTSCSTSVNEYIKKDGNFRECGEFSPLRKSRTKKFKLTNSQLLYGDLIDFIETDQISVKSLVSVLNARKVFFDLKIVSNNPPLGSVINTIWNELPSIDVFDSSVKNRHYWIYSTVVNKGKTTFLKTLLDSYRTYRFNVLEKYQDVSDDTEIVVFDEYAKGHSMTLTHLNSICDGIHRYPKKNGPSVVLKFPLVIICSNFSISQIYNDPMGRLQARFREVCIDTYTFKS